MTYSYLDDLNDQQREAVLTTEGPVLILAGAGSGKTKTVTQKIAYLIEEKGVSPYHILAFTFTNKAAQEMRDRVEVLLNRSVQGMWIGTFHSICVRILRRYHKELGYDSNFSIYDRSDQLRAVKEALKELNLSKELFKERSVLAAIGSFKNRGIGPGACLDPEGSNFYDEKIAQVYALYEEKLKENNAMDFDDLLLKVVELLSKNEEARAYYQFQFDYFFVDEYQDTNPIQYQLIKLLCPPNPNLTVVGDNDQSIYAWRGADISNILNFEKDFPRAKVILLEQNYRSSQNILKLANKVIANNPNRKDKRLWTNLEEGKRVQYREYNHSEEENKDVVNLIIQARKRGYAFSDMAILYRTNAQSRGFEEYLMMEGIPYKVVGGLKFYDRKEVKDILAYLSLISNPKDDLALARIINVPKRGIGQASLDQLQAYGREKDLSIYEVMEGLREEDDLKLRARKNCLKFVDLIHLLQEKAQDLSLPDLMEAVLFESEYLKELQEEDTIESRNRIENLEELVSAAKNYEKENPEDKLEDFLSSLSLLSDVDKTEEKEEGVQLMTVHGAKGLEFPLVFLVGMEERIFPSGRSLDDDEENLEEERRLCYVAITRAKKELYISSARNRVQYGKTVSNLPSRFIEEMGDELDQVRTYEGSYRAKEAPSLEVRAYPGSKESFKGNLKQGPKEDPAYHSESKKDIYVGAKVRHKKWGVGMVVSLKEKGDDREVVVSFDGKGLKKLLLSYAPLEVVSK